MRATAQTIVDEGRRLIGCDRLSLAQGHGRKCRLLAVSGADEVERRSNLVRTLEQLGSRVLVYGEPLWYPAARETLAPDSEQALEAYLDESHARVLGVLPLAGRATPNRPGERPEVVGLLLVEQFHAAAIEPALVGRAEAVARHAASALTNAADYDSLPLIRLERGLQGLRWLTRARQLPKRWSPCWRPWQPDWSWRWCRPISTSKPAASCNPKRARDIFAPSDAIVSGIRVAERRQVQAGDVLVTLRRPQLDFELHRVLGETQTARQHLAGVQAARLGPRARQDRHDPALNQLTAERRNQGTADQPGPAGRNSPRPSSRN